MPGKGGFREREYTPFYVQYPGVSVNCKGCEAPILSISALDMLCRKCTSACRCRYCPNQAKHVPSDRPAPWCGKCAPPSH